MRPTSAEAEWTTSATLWPAGARTKLTRDEAAKRSGNATRHLTIGATRHFKTLFSAASDPGGAANGANRPPVYGPRRDTIVRQAALGWTKAGSLDRFNRSGFAATLSRAARPRDGIGRTQPDPSGHDVRR